MNISKRSFGLILLYYVICLGEGRGHSTKFYAGRLHPGVQTLTLLYTIFDKKGTPFIYLLQMDLHVLSVTRPLVSHHPSKTPKIFPVEALRLEPLVK